MIEVDNKIGQIVEAEIKDQHTETSFSLNKTLAENISE